MAGTDLYRELIAKDPNIARSFVFITGDKASVDIEDALAKRPPSGEAVHHGGPERSARARRDTAAVA